MLHDADYGSIFGVEPGVGNRRYSAGSLLNGQAAPVLYAAANQINFQIPAGFPVGPATLQVNNGSVNAYPVYLQIDSFSGGDLRFRRPGPARSPMRPAHRCRRSIRAKW